MEIQICTGKMCSERFSCYIKTRLENDKEKFNLENLNLEDSPCMGECKVGPNIKIDGEKFTKMNPAKASELLFKKGKNVKTKKHEN